MKKAATKMPNTTTMRRSATKRSSLSSAEQKQKLISSVLITLLGLGGSVFFGLQVLASPAKPAIIVQAAQKQKVFAPAVSQFLLASEPTRVRISSINVNAPLVAVAQKSNGSIEVPAPLDTAGWYSQGPTPGEAGPAVLVGHLDNIHGGAVFWHVPELVPGQIIEINRQDGNTARFVIEKIGQFPQSNFPSATVYGHTDRAELRLITCGGEFNRLTGQYSDNIVVFASLVTEDIVKDPSASIHNLLKPTELYTPKKLDILQ